MRIILLFGLFLISVDVHAYVGPGLGLGVLGVIFGAIIAFLLAIFGVLWYPIKRRIKKKKAQDPKSEEAPSKAPESQTKEQVD